LRYGHPQYCCAQQLRTGGAYVLAKLTPGTWITLVAPVPRMILMSDCMPTVYYPSEQLAMLEMGIREPEASYCASPLFQ
jgi:hypothetical protein